MLNTVFGYPSWLVPVVGWGAVVVFLVTVVGNTLRPKYRRLFGWKAPFHALWNAGLPSAWVQIYLWSALILLWTPVWWLARIISGVSGFGSPTTWFVMVALTFYGSWLARGLNGLSVNPIGDSAEVDGPASVSKRVAVIGAGMAGLVAAKELKEEGHDVVVFERTDGPGGVWASSKARGGMAWGSTLTSTGTLNTTFSDSLTQVFHPENEPFPQHLDRRQFLDLLLQYESRHGVFDAVLRCNTEVEAMSTLPGNRWRLRVRDHALGMTEEEDFDAVTVCTGLNNEAFTPVVAGQDRFAGPQLHAEDYRPDIATRFAGRRVLVVGMGETSSDVVKDLVDQHAEHVYVSQRGPTWVIPRIVGNLPADHVETRLVHDGPMWHRWAMLLTGVAPFALWRLLPRRRIDPPRFRHVIRILVMHHPRKLLLWRLGSINWTKSDNLYFALDTGRATVVRDLVRLDDGHAVFADGRTEQVDAVIYCTGYRPGPSLLPPVTTTGESANEAEEPPTHLPPRSSRDLYKLTIPPDHPNVAVIGFARGQIGAITLSTEMQARWWALVLSGRRRLPNRSEMDRHARRMSRNGRRFHQPTRTTPCFAYSLARQDIGCEPDMFRLFLADRRLWFAVLMGPVCAAHFRFRGPHAKPEEARRQLLMSQAVQSDDYIDSVDLLTGALPLAALVVPLHGAYSRLLPGFNVENATRSYI